MTRPPVDPLTVWPDDPEPRSTPSLTIPLVLLCAVVGAVLVAWVVTR